ncbi:MULTISPECIES: hypothetical protein [unclassified Microbacterium]|nr:MULTISPECIES: hypothetical protein [unclassified Microbacterium]
MFRSPPLTLPAPVVAASAPDESAPPSPPPAPAPGRPVEPGAPS